MIKHPSDRAERRRLKRLDNSERSRKKDTLDEITRLEFDRALQRELSSDLKESVSDQTTSPQL